MAERQIGSAQKAVLRNMIKHGGTWNVGCGWVWDTERGTILIIESLVRRGLVRKVIVEKLYDRYELV